MPASQRLALEDVRRSLRVIYVFMVLAVCFAPVLGVLRYLGGDHVIGLASLGAGGLGLGGVNRDAFLYTLLVWPRGFGVAGPAEPCG